MSSMAPYSAGSNGLNPNNRASVGRSSTSTVAATKPVARASYLPDQPRKNPRYVRTTGRMVAAESTNLTNQLV